MADLSKKYNTESLQNISSGVIELILKLFSVLKNVYEFSSLDIIPQCGVSLSLSENSAFFEHSLQN